MTKIKYWIILFLMQSHIFLTQTFIDEDKIKKLIAHNYFATGKFEVCEDFPATENLDESWEHNSALNSILTPDFQKKSDYTEEIMSFYQSYTKSTLLFLGNLDQYSEALQEGMLRLLEEPPKNLHIVLFASTKNGILSTISSRCKFHHITRNIVIKLLDNNLLEKIKKKLPLAGDVAKQLIQDKDSFTIPDLSTLEREEIDFWLWQIGCYLEEYYKQKPNLKVAGFIEKILYSQSLNQKNLQKKFAVGYLKTE